MAGLDDLTGLSNLGDSVILILSPETMGTNGAAQHQLGELRIVIKDSTVCETLLKEVFGIALERINAFLK